VVVLLDSAEAFGPLRDDDAVGFAYVGAGTAATPRVGIPAAGICFGAAGGAVTGLATSPCMDIACSLKNTVKSREITPRNHAPRAGRTCALQRQGPRTSSAPELLLRACVTRLAVKQALDVFKGVVCDAGAAMEPATDQQRAGARATRERSTANYWRRDCQFGDSSNLTEIFATETRFETQAKGVQRDCNQ
jgi:hypothetical protein